MSKCAKRASICIAEMPLFLGIVFRVLIARVDIVPGRIPMMRI
jgi:hypothetical protein